MSKFRIGDSQKLILDSYITDGKYEYAIDYVKGLVEFFDKALGQGQAFADSWNVITGTNDSRIYFTIYPPEGYSRQNIVDVCSDAAKEFDITFGVLGQRNNEEGKRVNTFLENKINWSVEEYEGEKYVTTKMSFTLLGVDKFAKNVDRRTIDLSVNFDELVRGGSAKKAKDIIAQFPEASYNQKTYTVTLPDMNKGLELVRALQEAGLPIEPYDYDWDENQFILDLSYARKEVGESLFDSIEDVDDVFIEDKKHTPKGWAVNLPHLGGKSLEQYRAAEKRNQEKNLEANNAGAKKIEEEQKEYNEHIEKVNEQKANADRLMKYKEAFNEGKVSSLEEFEQYEEEELEEKTHDFAELAALRKKKYILSYDPDDAPATAKLVFAGSPADAKEYLLERQTEHVDPEGFMSKIFSYDDMMRKNFTPGDLLSYIHQKKIVADAELECQTFEDKEEISNILKELAEKAKAGELIKTRKDPDKVVYADIYSLIVYTVILDDEGDVTKVIVW